MPHRSAAPTLAGLLILIPFAGSCEVRAGAKPRTLIVISIDTLRPERLGVYGNSAEVSPELDALARESMVFDQALTTAPWTLPAHMSMMTGLDPVAHGVRNVSEVLSPNLPTLSGSLRSAGYATAAFTDGGFISKVYGFDRGFDLYEEPASGEAPSGFAHSIPRAIAWLDAHAEGNTFLFLHTFDVHAPYTAGDPEVFSRFRGRPTPDGEDDHWLREARYLYAQRNTGVSGYGRLSELLNDYDAGVHEADRGVGRLLDHLRRSGRYEDALIVVLSDHGESFFDHDVYAGHGLFLTDDEIHIPCILKLPHREGAGKRVSDLVDVLDLYPTVLDVAGLQKQTTLQGESWLGFARGEPRRRKSSFAESFNTESYSLTAQGYKYISPSPYWPMTIVSRHLGPETPTMLDGSRPGKEYKIGVDQPALSYAKRTEPLGLRDRIPVTARLYDRKSDPKEEDDLCGRDSERCEKMKSDLERTWEASAAIQVLHREHAGVVENSPEHVEHLKALGYVLTEDDRGSPDVPLKLDLAAARGASFHPTGVDMEPLWRADRVVHRLSLAKDRPFGDREMEEARAAATTYTQWVLQHTDLQARAQWRLRAVQELCESRGRPLDPGIWADFQRWLDEHPQDADGSD